MNQCQLAMPTTTEQEIQRLEQVLENLLNEEEVMWDEVNAVERDLKTLRIVSEQFSD
jgi:type II secretory pathway component PulJ